jgi:hypothetical protein
VARRSLLLRPSSNIAGADYDPETETLTVRFHHGGASTHEGIEAATVAGFEMAPSPGRFYNERLKGR